MTIHWDPVEDNTDPDTIDVWHIADDGTESGPLTVDVSGVSGASSVGSDSTDGDVFLYDERAVQYRALAPDSTVPLGRIGLADRAALFSYGRLIDKTFETSGANSHTERFRYGDV